MPEPIDIPVMAEPGILLHSISSQLTTDISMATRIDRPAVMVPAIAVYVALVLVALDYAENPFIWILLSLAGILILASVLSGTATVKAIWLNLAVVCSFFLIVEVHSLLSISDGVEKIESNDGLPLHQPDDKLGYAPRGGVSATASNYFRDQLLYEVSYTIGANGLRITSEAESEDSGPCALFFGGSFTFGTGVEDHESMPYMVRRLAGYDTKNFGYGGYGPHQMLAAIDSGIVEKTATDCVPKAAIYQTAVFHAVRSAGKAFWDRMGPKYVLRADGTIEFKGQFDDEDALVKRLVLSQLNKSSAFNKYVWRRGRQATADDIDLMVGIVEAARNRLKKSYPELEFHVILWDTGSADTLDQRLLLGLRDRGLDVHLISEILPGLAADSATYLIEHDGHPNAEANKQIAAYVTEKILQ